GKTDITYRDEYARADHALLERCSLILGEVRLHRRRILLVLILCGERLVQVRGACKRCAPKRITRHSPGRALPGCARVQERRWGRRYRARVEAEAARMREDLAAYS